MQILLYPDERLTAKAVELKEYTPETSRLVAEMLRLTSTRDGAGLAAPQVGWSARLFILSAPAAGDRDPKTRIVWNPSIETSGDLVPMGEGCLSFPGVWAEIQRWTRVRLLGQTPEGPIDEVFIGFGAQAVQHEMDHLEGLLFLEKMTEADRRLNEPILAALREGAKRKGGGPKEEFAWP